MPILYGRSTYGVLPSLPSPPRVIREECSAQDPYWDTLANHVSPIPLLSSLLGMKCAGEAALHVDSNDANIDGVGRAYEQISK